MKPFFIEIQNFLAYSLGHLGIFGCTISTHFGKVSPLSMFFIILPLLFLQNNKAFLSTFQIFIWDWGLNLGREELTI